MSDVLRLAKWLVSLEDTPVEYRNADDQFDYDGLSTKLRAVGYARALIETQKRLDEALMALQRIEGNWQQAESIKDNAASGHKLNFLTVEVVKGEVEA